MEGAMSDASRDELAEEIENARTVFVVYEDQDGHWGTYRHTFLDGYDATASCLTAAIGAREYAREFLDDVAADDPELVHDAEDVFAGTVGNGGRR